MKLDLGTITDDIDGTWWLHHRAKDFGFFDKIQDQSAHDVDVDDILIHKKIIPGERFPTIRYHVVTASGTCLATNAEAKDIMARSLVAFVNTNAKLPFACTYVKEFKNGAVQVDYAPTTWDRFAIKIERAAGPGEGKSFPQLEAVPTNPAMQGQGGAAGAQPAPAAATTTATASPRQQGRGNKIAAEPTIQAITAATGGAVCIFDAEITSIERRESHYQDEVTVYYVVGLKGGSAAPDSKKSTDHEPFGEIRARLSEAIVTASSLATGDRITFNGRLKEDRYLGFLLQNVKKVTKT